MPDYDLLRAYLATQTKDEIVLTMDAIEEIIDDALPRASHRASWWETERAQLLAAYGCILNERGSSVAVAVAQG